MVIGNNQELGKPHLLFKQVTITYYAFNTVGHWIKNFYQGYIIWITSSTFHRMFGYTGVTKNVGYNVNVGMKALWFMFN